MSFIATLTIDTTTITSPTWTDVEREIGALDARTQTLVMLAPPPPKGAPKGDHHRNGSVGPERMPVPPPVQVVAPPAFAPRAGEAPAVVSQQ